MKQFATILFSIMAISLIGIKDVLAQDCTPGIARPEVFITSAMFGDQQYGNFRACGPSGDTVFTITITNPIARLTYLWSNGMTGTSLTLSVNRNTPVLMVRGYDSRRNCFSDSTNISTDYDQGLPPPQVRLVGSNTICKGDSVLYTLQNFIPGYRYGLESSNGLFYNPLPIQDTAVWLKRSGVYTLYVGTPVNGGTPTPYCVTPSASIRINVIGDSLPEIRTTITEICNGAPITLTSTVGKNIRWSTGDTTRTITVSTPGLYTLRSTASCGYGGSTDTIKIVDLSNFTPEIGPQVNSVTVFNRNCIRTNERYMELRAYPGAGETVLWNDGSSTTRKFIFGAATYSYTITRNGCISRPRVFTLRDLTDIRVIAASGTSLCSANDSIRLIINERNLQGTYQWYNGSNPIAGATDSFYVARAFGNYSVKVAADTNCTIQSIEWVVSSQNNFYRPTIISFQNRLIASLSDTSSITRYYFWYGNDTLVQSSTSNTYYPRTSNAGFSVRYALNAGGTCLSPMSSTFYYTAASTKFGNVQLSIVPNPASTDITITGIKPEKVRNVLVISASGKTSAIAFNANAQSLEANISSLATGLYMLQIELEDGSLALSKLVKK